MKNTIRAPIVMGVVALFVLIALPWRQHRQVMQQPEQVLAENTGVVDHKGFDPAVTAQPATGRRARLMPTARKPNDSELLDQRIWENMTDEDREAKAAMDAAFEEAQRTGDYTEWNRLLVEETQKPPWEHESRQEQQTRIEMGWTNRTVIEIQGGPDQKPLFFPSNDNTLPVPKSKILRRPSQRPQPAQEPEVPSPAP